MNRLQYLDFELVIEKADSQYLVRVVRSPVGEASHLFSLPFSDLELENLILKLGTRLRGRRRISSPEMELARRFGSKLFEAVFRGDVRASFLSGQHEAERSGLGLRLKLRLDAPELINVPWEYLYDDSVGRFLSLFEGTPIVRYVDMRGSIAPLRVSPPLSVLIMLSRPSGCEELDVEREKENLESALSDLRDAGMLTLTVLENATLPALADCLLRGRYHVFHYIGHGGFDERSQDGVLVLEDEWGRSHLASGERMAVLLGNHTTLRLVVLNACEGARTSRDDPFAGTATTLVRTGGVPAVVAMQFAITDEAAITFARGFYTALSVGRPVDAAVSQARLAIFADDNDVEWGTPVLYMRAPDGCIFDVAALTPEQLEERRRAAQAARAEREAAERRAKEQREARLEELRERAVTLLKRKDWAAAQEALAELEELAPGDRELAALVEQAQAGIEEQERCAALYRSAQEHLEAGRLAEAVAGFQSVLDLDADHEDAARQLTGAQARLEQQQEDERIQREALARLAELDRLFAAGEAAAQAGDWAQAAAAFEEVLGQDEHHGGAAARLEQAREALALEQAEQQRQEALARRYDDACERMEAGDWPEAERLLREIQEEVEDYPDVEALLAQATSERQAAERLEQLYAEAEEAFSRGAWKRADTLYKEVLALKPGYREAEARSAEAQRQQQLAEQYSHAWAHLKAERWQDAIDGFAALVELEPGYGQPARGRAADLLAKAQQKQEWADLPAPPIREPPRPADSRPKPTVLPEEIKRRGKPAEGAEEEKAESPGEPPEPAARPKPSGLPEEVKRRGKPAAGPEEEKAESPGEPPEPAARPKPSGLPEEVKRRDKPDDLPS